MQFDHVTNVVLNGGNQVSCFVDSQVALTRHSSTRCGIQLYRRIFVARGRTAHYKFNVPLTLDGHHLGRNTYVHRYAIEPGERSLRDVRNCNELFGRVPVLCGVRFLSKSCYVITDGRHDIVAEALRHSYIWPQLNRFHLTSNNRAMHNDFANCPIEIGAGRRSNNAENLMMLPRDIVIETNNMDTFINTVFPDLHQHRSNTEYLAKCDFNATKLGC
ncbi:hypothetical protein ROZALSC1DRAFT_31427 [Rozella allomycis CSF55]|uniref:Uncharacterized protein n=1 Tax=Rozella allomycis (strain CSF55) TaxID=988480 RepID=A0A075B1E1_ROZAC|nr:hypothetical protein O9G_005845 [Rozella allomycis CSF55]RKP16693.1 hypothetical protein ROZALSC1DRAFT_31427 [Rozella allomycis CSF55]|eukprot:EPZ36363.1 hypothetical protein O9G_005845 [Rozella allomycis CSF55]